MPLVSDDQSDNHAPGGLSVVAKAGSGVSLLVAHLPGFLHAKFSANGAHFAQSPHKWALNGVVFSFP